MWPLSLYHRKNLGAFARALQGDIKLVGESKWNAGAEEPLSLGTQAYQKEDGLAALPSIRISHTSLFI